jgi:hypothetical protein
MAVRREETLSGSARRSGRKDRHMADLGTPELLIVVVVGVLWTTLRR